MAQLIMRERVAEALHKSCRLNHIDYCDFYYSSWEDPGYTKKEYLKKADVILKKSRELNISDDTLLSLIQIILSNL